MQTEKTPKNSWKQHDHQAPSPCPLCSIGLGTIFFEDRFRSYLQCDHCGLVFVPSQYWLDPMEEKAVYDLHENHAHDPGYQRFLSRLTDPLSNCLTPGQKGLDFGCGPGPVLSGIMAEQGFDMKDYDLFYFNEASLLNTTYDFITATEVVEHLRHPAQVFETLFSMLKPKGVLGLMTKQVIDRQAFKTWHYIRDLTHLVFYSPPVFDYLANRFNARLECIGNDVILFHRN